VVGNINRGLQEKSNYVFATTQLQLVSWQVSIHALILKFERL